MVSAAVSSGDSIGEKKKKKKKNEAEAGSCSFVWFRIELCEPARSLHSM